MRSNWLSPSLSGPAFGTNRSAGDLAILLRTPAAIFRGEGSH
jgi:hypothetical protein